MLTNTKHLVRRGVAAVALILLIAALYGCGGQKTEGETAKQETSLEQATNAQTTLTAEEEALVQQAAAIANAIEMAPESAEAILTQYGMTAAEFESLLYDIAAKPALAATYEEARKIE